MKYSASIFSILCVGIISLGLSSCVRVPQHAPLLSQELGKSISALEQSHLALLSSYFDAKRERVNEFLLDQWLPIFAEEFFGDPVIMGVWNEVVESSELEDRVKFITMVGPRLQHKINQKSQELFMPLNQLERRLEKEIRNSYLQSRAMNNSITSYLFSASKVDENRQRYLDMVGVNDEKIGGLLNATDRVVSSLLTPVQSIDNVKTVTEDYIGKINNLLSTFEKK